MRISIRPSDRVFSQFIRLRDRQCMRCLSPVRLNDEGMPVSHTNSHYFGRGRESTRFDPENCDVLCLGCHQIWGSSDKEGYRQFKINQLGQKGFDRLTLRANLIGKRDDKMDLMRARLLLKTLERV